MPLTSALLESAESTSAVCDTTSTTDCQRTAASWSCSRSGIQAGEQRRISDDQRESRNANGVALSPTHRPTVGTGQRPSLRPESDRIAHVNVRELPRLHSSYTPPWRRAAVGELGNG